MEIHRMLALSTGHLTEHTCNTWLPEAADKGFTAYEMSDYGWLVLVLDLSNEHSLPTDLEQIMLWAKDHQFSWLMFDRDVRATDEFPYFDW